MVYRQPKTPMQAGSRGACGGPTVACGALTATPYNGRFVRAVVQRVSSAEVSAAGNVLGQCGQGLLVLLGVGREDTRRDATYLAAKTAGLRIFAGPDGRLTRSARDIGAALLVVPQFTLYGDVRRGLRPSFDSAAPPQAAETLYEEYVRLLRNEGLEVATGEFQATMQVSLVNEGPVTILLDSTKLF